MYRILSALFLVSVLGSIARNVSAIESEKIRSNCPDEADKWPCRSGACIPIYEVCDGIRHCRDSSDENEEVCRDTQCAEANFRCAYGACISIERICDGVDDCLDSSDEEHEMCLKRRLEDKFGEEAQRKKCAGFGQMKCWSGQCVRTMDKCNGVVDCADGSDEWPNLCTMDVCDENTQFKCNYGACIDLSAKCNGTEECWDKSDEAVEFCELADNSTTIIPDFTEEPATNTTARYPIKYQKPRYCSHQWIADNSAYCTLKSSKVKCENILPGTIVHIGCKFDVGKCHKCTTELQWVNLEADCAYFDDSFSKFTRFLFGLFK